MKKKYFIKKPNYNIKIISQKIILVPIIKKHISKEYLSWLKNKKLTKYLELRNNKISTNNVINYINFLRSDKNLECFAIEDKNSRHIGNIFITKVDKINKIGTYGILIGDTKSRLSGYGLFSSLLIIEYLFNQLKINKIQGSCITKNYSSWKLLENLGFEKEGFLKNQCYKSNNNYYDSFLYGLQKKDWKIKKKKFNFFLKNIQYTRKLKN